jgi:tRNA dimethylallyltransferase
VQAHEAIDTALADGLTRVVVGGTRLYFRGRTCRSVGSPAPAPGARERWSAVYEDEGPSRHTRCSPSWIPRQRRSCTRTIAVASCRALELAEAGHSLRGDRLWSADTRHPTLVVGLDVPPDELDRRIEERTRAMFEAGVEQEVRGALDGGLSSTARKILGLREVAELPRADAEREVSAQTRRLAAYQRKWMRRIPVWLPCGPTVLPTRWPMTFSRWRAAGNEYLLAERTELGGRSRPSRPVPRSGARTGSSRSSP